MGHGSGVACGPHEPSGAAGSRLLHQNRTGRVSYPYLAIQGALHLSLFSRDHCHEHDGIDRRTVERADDTLWAVTDAPFARSIAPGRSHDYKPPPSRRVGVALTQVCQSCSGYAVTMQHPGHCTNASQSVTDGASARRNLTI